MQDWWRKAHQHAKRLRNFQDLASATVLRSRQCSIWGLWVSESIAHRQAKYLHIKAGLFRKEIALSKGMCAFKNILDDRRSQALLRGKAVLHHMTVRCGSILAKWKAYSGARRWQRVRLAAAKSRMAVRCQRACLLALGQHAQEHQSARNKFVIALAGVTAKGQRSLLSSVVTSWHYTASYGCALRLVEGAARAQCCKAMGLAMTERFVR